MEWKKVDEKTPHDTKILLYWPRYYCPSYGDDGRESRVAVGWWKGNNRIIFDQEARDRGLEPYYFSDTSESDDYGLALKEFGPTHWMPMPTPPTD